MGGSSIRTLNGYKEQRVVNTCIAYCHVILRILSLHIIMCGNT